MLNHASVNEPNGCLQVQKNDVDQVQSTPHDVSRTLAILPSGKHQLNLRTCPPELLLFVKPRTTPFGLKENRAFNFHGSVVPGEVLSLVSRRRTCPSKEWGEKKVFSCAIHRVCGETSKWWIASVHPEGHRQRRRPLLSQLKLVLENDRREDPHPAQRPRAEQGWGLAGAGRGGCDRDVHRPQDEQQEQGE